jgi:hypothetical protein
VVTIPGTIETAVRPSIFALRSGYSGTTGRKIAEIRAICGSRHIGTPVPVHFVIAVGLGDVIYIVQSHLVFLSSRDGNTHGHR